MDSDKIFLKDACPTAIGGQAVMEGIMMRGSKKIALAVRTGEDTIYLRTKYVSSRQRFSNIPILRGIVAFWDAMVEGTRTLIGAANILEEHQVYGDESGGSKMSFDEKLALLLEKKFGKKFAWNLMIYISVIFAVVFSVGVFVLLPTWIVGLVDDVFSSHVAKSFLEGIIRLILFVLYIVAISKMEDIKRVFQYHGAEHKTIHCFEKGEELTPENVQKFYRLHPRCGTSFLVFVMVITILVFPIFGWPDLLERLVSRIVLIPLIAGLSYELLRWAGRSNSSIVRLISMPGIYLQKITTKEPDTEMLQVAIVAMKAVLPEEDGTPLFDGMVDNEGVPIDNRIEVNEEDVSRSEEDEDVS